MPSRLKHQDGIFQRSRAVRGATCAPLANPRHLVFSAPDPMVNGDPMRRLACLCLPFLAGPAFAQQVDCKSPKYQVEMTFCAEQSWIAADEELNVAFRTAREAMRKIDSALPAEQKGAETQLRDAQRAWITFRDATCAAEGYSYHGGSAEPMVIYSCRARVTKARALDLWAMTALPG